MLQNFFSRLSPQEKRIFYATVILVVVALFDRLFLGPATARLRSLDDEIKDEESVIKSNLRFLSFKEKILKENAAFKPYFLTKAKTEEEIIATFLKKVEILASEAKVNLIRVNPSDSRQKKGFMEYYANLDCEGALEDVVKFMYAVDTSLDLLKIVKLSMNPKRAGSEEINATMTIVKVIVDDSSLREAEKIIGKAAPESAALLDAGDATGELSDNENGTVEGGFVNSDSAR